jgi:hypothetical protein
MRVRKPKIDLFQRNPLFTCLSHRLFDRALQLLHPLHSFRRLHIHAARLGLQLICRRLIRSIFLRVLWRGQGQGTSQKWQVERE